MILSLTIDFDRVTRGKMTGYLLMFDYSVDGSYPCPISAIRLFPVLD